MLLPPRAHLFWQKSDFRRKNWKKFAMQKQTTDENKMTTVNVAMGW